MILTTTHHISVYLPLMILSDIIIESDTAGTITVIGKLVATVLYIFIHI